MMSHLSFWFMLHLQCLELCTHYLILLCTDVVWFCEMFQPGSIKSKIFTSNQIYEIQNTFQKNNKLISHNCISQQERKTLKNFYEHYGNSKHYLKPENCSARPCECISLPSCPKLIGSTKKLIPEINFVGANMWGIQGCPFRLVRMIQTNQILKTNTM